MLGALSTFHLVGLLVHQHPRTLQHRPARSSQASGSPAPHRGMQQQPTRAQGAHSVYLHPPAPACRLSQPVQVARFVRFCDSFSFPLLILLDPSPAGPVGGLQSEDLQGAAQLMFAFVEASVPKLALLLSPDQAARLLNTQVRDPSLQRPVPACIMQARMLAAQIMQLQGRGVPVCACAADVQAQFLLARSCVGMH